MIILSFRTELTFKKKIMKLACTHTYLDSRKKTLKFCSSDSNQNLTPSAQRHLIFLEFITNSATECRQQNSYAGLLQLSILKFSLPFNLPIMGREEELQSRSSACSSQHNESSPVFI